MVVGLMCDRYGLALSLSSATPPTLGSDGSSDLVKASPNGTIDLGGTQEALMLILTQDRRLADSLAALSAERNILLTKLNDAKQVSASCGRDVNVNGPVEEVVFMSDAQQSHRSDQSEDTQRLEKSSTNLLSGASFAHLMMGGMKEAKTGTSDSLPSVCRDKDEWAEQPVIGAFSSYDNPLNNAADSDKPFHSTSIMMARNCIRDFALAQGWIKPPSEQRHGCVAKCVFGTWFDAMCAIIIVLNSVLLGFSTNYSAEHGIADENDMPVVFSLLDQIFNWWFVFELLLRVKADGIVTFWSCHVPHWTWNYFDTVIVVTSVVETFVQMVSQSGAGSNLTTLRMLRVLRVARALRVVRLVRIFKSLRMMVLSILSSFATLIWAIVLLVIMMFIFGIFLTQNVTSYLSKDKDEYGNLQSDDAKRLQGFFGSLMDAVYTLFLSVAGGISWNEVSDPLFKSGPSNGLLFCFYIFFTMFAMLNIVTGIFLDTAMRAAQNDKDECISEHLHAENSTVRLMQAIFDEVDEDKSGLISFTEFQAHIRNPSMRAHLASLGIQADEAEGLFRLLDLDGSGTVTVEEFLFGCLRVKGHAKAIDVATLMYENKRMVHKWTVFMKYVEKMFKTRRAFELRLEAKMDRLRGLEPLPFLPSRKIAEPLPVVLENSFSSSERSPDPPVTPDRLSVGLALGSPDTKLSPERFRSL